MSEGNDEAAQENWKKALEAEKRQQEDAERPESTPSALASSEGELSAIHESEDELLNDSNDSNNKTLDLKEKPEVDSGILAQEIITKALPHSVAERSEEKVDTGERETVKPKAAEFTGTEEVSEATLSQRAIVIEPQTQEQEDQLVDEVPISAMEIDITEDVTSALPSIQETLSELSLIHI